jgi:hypothetical protein
MNTFNKFKTYLNSKNILDYVTRKEIMSNIDGLDTTIDKYRAWFCAASYLKWINRGEYQIIRKIPDSLTSEHLEMEAYPHRFKKEIKD